MSVSIVNIVLQFRPDRSKSEGYAMNLDSYNFKIKWHYTVKSAGLDDSSCLTGCLYIDANNAWEHLTTKLVSALANHKNARTLINSKSEMVVFTYQTKSNITPLNNWDKSDYFTTAFLSLFLFEIGGHLTQKDGPRRVWVLFWSWAK